MSNELGHAVSDERRIEWRKTVLEGLEDWPIYEAYVDNRMVGWIEHRQHYCDRGHFKAMVDAPNLDHQDAFPRYFMRFSTAVQEMEEFLRWRLWKIRSGGETSPSVFMDATQRIPKA